MKTETGRPYLGLALLTGLNLFNYLDRYVLASVVPPIKAELHLSDGQIGWLTSAFMIGYFATAPAFGYLANAGAATAAACALGRMGQAEARQPPVLRRLSL